MRDVWFEEYGDVWNWEEIAVYARENEPYLESEIFAEDDS
jgi:hypothetical protein